MVKIGMLCNVGWGLPRHRSCYLMNLSRHQQKLLFLQLVGHTLMNLSRNQQKLLFLLELLGVELQPSQVEHTNYQLNLNQNNFASSTGWRVQQVGAQ